MALHQNIYQALFPSLNPTPSRDMMYRIERDDVTGGMPLHNTSFANDAPVGDDIEVMAAEERPSMAGDAPTAMIEAYEQARPSFPPPSAPQRKPVWEDLHPEYVDPYPDPQNEGERAANLLARNQETIRNPVNEDKGAKGRIKEIIQGFLAGMAQTPQGADWKQALVLGGVGAGGATLNRKWNEKRQAEMEAPRLMQNVKIQQDVMDAQAKRDYQKANTDWLKQRPSLEQQKIDDRSKHSERTNLTRQYNSLPSYSETDADDKAFGDIFEQTFGYRPLEKNANTKSEQVIDQSNGQVYLIQTDKQGGQKIVKITNDDGTPFVIETKEQLASADKAKQRDLQKLLANNRNVTSVKVAQINAGSREKVAGINQEGAMQRAKITDKTQRDKVLAAIEQGKPLDGETPEQTAERKRLAIENFLKDNE